MPYPSYSVFVRPAQFPDRRRRLRLRGRGYFQRVGPGLITGAADDDPSGIATYSQVGAAFGFQFLWTTVLAFPLAAAVQEATARLGLISGKGLAALIKQEFPRWVLYVAVMLVVAANSFNIGADLGSMAAATRLLVPIPQALLVLLFALGMAAIEIVVPYHRYARVLRWLCLSLVSYLAVLFIVDIAWRDAVRNLLVPSLRFRKEELAAMIALFGTTISPYLFFWQTSEEVEELHDHGATNGNGGATGAHMRAMRGDVVTGIGSGVFIMFAIMTVSAATLGKNGITSIGTAEEAAMALEPLAGSAAKLLFTLGIVGTGLLAVPVLAGSTAFALAETFEWKEGLSLRMTQAKAFYMVILGSMIVGLMFNFLGLNPVRALYWSAILNGLAAPPLIVMILVLSRRRRILQDHVSGRTSTTLVATAAFLSTVVPALFFFAS
jgi:NRAMP (natural resistance-associated macrophage protein)-like metal ion transporter